MNRNRPQLEGGCFDFFHTAHHNSAHEASSLDSHFQQRSFISSALMPSALSLWREMTAFLKNPLYNRSKFFVASTEVSIGYRSEAMSLKPFTYPFPETRFLHSGSNVYKFKIRYGNRVRKEDVENKEVIVQELEDSIRVVLGNLDNLQPFTTKHFIVFPYKSRWERVSHLKFKHGETALVPYPFVLTLYVEMKWFHENLSPGKPINDSALGLVLTEREAAGAIRRKRKRTEVSSSPSRPGLDRAKMRTSSQGPSKKKLLVETSRNRERKTQQECQETSAFGVTDVQEQDSRWEDSQAGDIIPPGQQSSPSLPKEPADLGTSGFFGFLSSLFPFRYFFRKSSQ